MTLQRAVAKRITQICRQRNISYYQLSYLSAVPLTTILHIIDGATKNTGISTIGKICDGLGMSLAVFFSSEYFEGVDYEEK